MLVYESDISIKIDFYNPEKEIELKARFNAITENNQIQANIKIKTNGEPNLNEIAKQIWDINEGFAQIEFLIYNSNLILSSPTLFDKDKYELFPK